MEDPEARADEEDEQFDVTYHITIPGLLGKPSMRGKEQAFVVDLFHDVRWMSLYVEATITREDGTTEPYAFDCEEESAA
jgi:hypothetical protein